MYILKDSEHFAKKEYAKHNGNHQWNHVEDSIKVAKEFLEDKNYPKDKIEKVLEIIKNHSGPHRRKFGEADMIEGKIVYDADKFNLAKTKEGFEKYFNRFYLDETRELIKDFHMKR